MCTNINGTLNVLQAARDLGTERIVHTSTSEVYGTARYAPIDETHPLQGQSPLIRLQKSALIKLPNRSYLSFNTPVVTVRPFNTFGARQSTRAVIPTIITQCLQGDIVRLGSIHPKRDLNYVANTVDGFIKAAASDSAVGQTMNIGSGREISIGDLANLIAQLIGREITIESDAQRLRPEKSEVDRLIASNDLAQTLIDWQPLVSLEEGLKITIEWMRDHSERYRTGVYTI